MADITKRYCQIEYIYSLAYDDVPGAIVLLLIECCSGLIVRLIGGER